MKKWLQNISAYGSQTVSDSHLQRRVVYSNLIFITLPFVYFIFMLLNFDTFFITDIKWVFDQFIVPIIILICMLCLALNKWGYIIISRILFFGVLAIASPHKFTKRTSSNSAYYRIWKNAGHEFGWIWWYYTSYSKNSGNGAID